MRIQNTTLMPDTWSLTRFFESFYGQRTSDWGRTANPKSTCWRQPKFLIWCWSWNYCIWPGKSYDFKFVAFTDTHRDLVWMILLTPKSEPDLTVDSSNWVIGVHSKDWDVPPTRVTELKFAKDQGFCATLSYVAFTDHENMIGDAMPIQNTAFDASRLFVDPVFWSVCCSLRATVFPGDERDWRCTANPECTVLTSAEVTDLMLELIYCIWPRKSYDFKFVAFTDTHRDLVWMILLTPKSEPDLTVDWSNWVIGVHSKDWDVPPTRVTELKFAKDQGFCATLSYVAFTDHENMIGDAMPIQNTAFDASRLFVDPVFWSVCCSLRATVFPGDERDWRCTANPECTVLTSAEVTDLMLELIYCIWPRKSYDFKFVAFTDMNRDWSGSISWLPRVSRTLQNTWDTDADEMHAARSWTNEVQITTGAPTGWNETNNEEDMIQNQYKQYSGLFQRSPVHEDEEYRIHRGWVHVAKHQESKGG